VGIQTVPPPYLILPKIIKKNIDFVNTLPTGGFCYTQIKQIRNNQKYYLQTNRNNFKTGQKPQKT